MNKENILLTVIVGVAVFIWFYKSKQKKTSNTNNQIQ